MDERLRICLWLVSGCCLGIVLGGVFGALTGIWTVRDGRAAGTGFGRRVAESLARTARHEMSPLRLGALTGAADGVLFLGIVGLATSAFVAIVAGADLRWLPFAALAATLLVSLAAFFGVLAYAMNGGVRTIGTILAGGLLGAYLAGFLLGADRLLLGVVPGLFVGLLLSFAARRYAPTFRPPRVPSDADSFPKPDVFDER
jgi:hypothetical protein